MVDVLEELSVVVPGEEEVVDDVEPLAGDEVVEVEVLLVLELLDPPPAGEGFTIVVLLSAFAAGDAPAAGATVSVFCSHAARSAALARIPMYFFIVWMGLPVSGYSLIRKRLANRSCLTKCCRGPAHLQSAGV